jgi:very-long-chain enoyl-CoA reductase
MKVVIVSGRREPKKETIELADTATLAQLKSKYKPSVSIHRKSFKLPAPEGQRAATLAGDEKTLTALGVRDGTELAYKDLGPQVGYRTVFVVEYAGPIAFMLLYAMRPSFIYGAEGAAKPLGDVQKLFVGAFIAHFVKRELETFFVHKFSRPTMPLMNIFKNSAYYWMFAAFMGYFLCHPQYTPPAHGLDKVAAIGMLLMELGNLGVHLQLAGMRGKEGDQTRDAPKGGFFSLVSCPNYSFEVMSWVFFSLGTNVFMSWMFTLVGLLQMSDWALKKHRGYVKAEPQLKRRKAILPFVL